MKKLCLFISLLLSFSLIGCCVNNVEHSSSPQITGLSTKNDLIKIFNSNTSHAKDRIIDCVIIEDAAYPLLGVIQYADEHDNPCNFNFITKEGACVPSNFSAYSGLTASPNLTLTYLGNGTASCTLLESDTLKPTKCYIQYKNKNENFII